jgi:hypothetical protein
MMQVKHMKNKNDKTIEDGVIDFDASEKMISMFIKAYLH